MYLRWGAHRPVWQRDTAEFRWPTLKQDLQVDVAIVGSGITGLTCALELCKAGLKVAVLTEGKIGSGATGATSAHITSVPDLTYQRLTANFGVENARRVTESLTHSLNRITKTVRDHRLACHFQTMSAYKFAQTESQTEELKREQAAASELGLMPVWNEKIQLPFEVSASLEFKNQAQFHPLQYVQGLAHTLAQLRCRIFQDSKVVEINDGHIQCERASVRAKHIIIATHSPIGVHLSIHTRVAPYFTYMMAARLLRPAPKGLFWDSSSPYFYMRSMNEEDQKMILIGGRDHKTGQEAHTKDRYLELESYLRERFEVADISYYWGHEVFESVDGLPYIGQIPMKKNLWTATGFAGCGMTFGTLAGEILADKVLERESKWADLYDPSRVKPFASVARFTKENVNAARWMVADWLSRDDRAFLSEIPLGTGRIIEGPYQKVAVYKGFDGQVQAMSPVCGHLGGIVHWNEIENTWDCPCHGSRYTCEGKVLCGPSLKDLEPVPLDESHPEGEVETVDNRDLPEAFLKNSNLLDNTIT
jgi:glycine/D-amino acid oxidase-like deaminating enzyme/nitrite reductase/ring-hydroxylating ferredoxin subunit